jgi:N-acetylglucosaminyl-diphospho-decaprenol L-rhamnosyltransferase
VTTTAELRVAAIVVTHGPCGDLFDCLTALAAQVDELVLVKNLPDETVLPTLPLPVTVVTNPRPVGYAANANRGIALTSAPWVVLSNPDAVVAPGCIETLRGFGETHPRCGLLAPQLRFPDGRWQTTQRRFPSVIDSLVRRTPLRLLGDPGGLQRKHYVLDEQPTIPVQAEWLVAAFLFMRRAALEEVGGLDAGYRLYVEEIDLAYRLAKAGWERWLVPDAAVVHRWEAVSDRRLWSRHSWWHLRSMARFLRKHPESLRRLR